MNIKINSDEDIQYLDFREVEYLINNNAQLSLEQKLLLWNKTLKMKFDNQTIKKLIDRVKNELDKIDNLYEIKRIQKKMYDLNLDTTYVNQLKKKILLKEMQNPNSQIGKLYTNIIINSKEKNRDE